MIKRFPFLPTAGVAVVAGGVLALAIAVSGCGGTPARPRESAPSTAPGTGVARPSGPAELASVVGAGTGASGITTGSAATITTQGVGTVTGTPNTMTLGVGVSTTAAHAATALTENNSIALQVQQALEAAGVPQADIQTTGLSLQPSQPNPGFQVYDEVTATVTNLAKAGTIIDDALAPAGDAGRLDEVNLSISDTSPLMVAAEDQAVAAAKDQAQQLATAAGEQLGRLVSLTDVPEQSQGVVSPAFSSSAGTAAAVPAVPVQPGTQQMSVQVTGVWDVSAG
jgi:uncharacterized protein